MPSVSQLSFLPRLLDTREKRSLAISIAVFILMVSTLLVRFWIRGTTIVPKIGGSYTEGLVGNPRFINPLLAPANDVDKDISALVFSGMMKIDEHGTVVTDLAESYTISQDQKTYTFKLRSGVLWHDREPLTVDDVVYTFKTIQDAAYKSPLRLTFAGIRVEATDRTTVTFTLQEPSPSFLTALTIGIMPEHIWYSIPAGQAHLAEANIKPIGSGLYRFKSLTKDGSGSIRSMTLERNDSYYAAPAYIQDINFKFYGDYPTAIEALKNKNIDSIGYLPIEYAMELNSFKHISVRTLQLAQYTAVFFNPTTNDILKDKNVRRALSYAVDRDRIVREVLGGDGTVVTAPLVPGFSNAATSTSQHYDPEQAKALLDQAGWKVTASSSIRMNKDRELSVILTTADQQEKRAVATIIKENLESIGVKVKANEVPKERIKLDILEPRNYQLLLFGQIIPSSQDLYAFWHSSQTRHPGANLSILGNKDIDAAVEQFRANQDETIRANAFLRITSKLSEESFAIFLYSAYYLYPVTSQLKGLPDNQRITIPSDRFAGIAQWYMRTGRKKQ